MAILKNSLEFTGGLGNLSAYKLPGMNETIVRTKGGANKKKIQKSPSFKLTRDNYTEFSACAKLGGSIRRSMLALAPLADYNYTPMLSSLAKTIQLLDTESIRGERNIFLSRHKLYCKFHEINIRPPQAIGQGVGISQALENTDQEFNEMQEITKQFHLDYMKRHPH